MPLRELPSPRWTPLAYLLVCAPLGLLVAVCFRDAYYDMQMIRVSALRDALSPLRSQAIRRAGRLEALVEAHQAIDQPWSQRRNQPWMQTFWSDRDEQGRYRLYWAVVDESGTIVMHSDAARVGSRLGFGEYERRVPEAGADVVQVQGGQLAGNATGYDVHVPLTAGGYWIGDYHEGLDGRWFETKVAGLQGQALWRWGAWLGLATALIAGAVWGLIFLTRRKQELGRELGRLAVLRAKELAQLGAGLAHEIRNPLHALRINLHTLRRAFGGRSTLPQEQLVATIQESDAAIDRLDGLMRDFVQFTDPSGGETAQIDMSREVQATLNLLAEDLRRDEIELRAELTKQAAAVAMNHARLRQLTLNLLTFAQHQAGKRGTIEVEVAPRGGGVELAVADSGPSLPDHEQLNVFEPFQAPAETGSGLGLALVQAFVEEAGGKVHCDRRTPSGNRFRVWLPLAGALKGGQS